MAMVKIEFIGLTTADGNVVAGVKAHFFDQMKARSVALAGAIDALENPLHITPDRTDPNTGEISRQYIGQNATVVYNPKTHFVVSAWPTSSDRVRKYKEIVL